MLAGAGRLARALGVSIGWALEVKVAEHVVWVRSGGVWITDWLEVSYQGVFIKQQCGERQ